MASPRLVPASQPNVFGVRPVYGHMPGPQERRLTRRGRTVRAAVAVGEGAAAVALTAFALLTSRR